jgi:hypothetical protein
MARLLRIKGEQAATAQCISNAVVSDRMLRFEDEHMHEIQQKVDRLYLLKTDLKQKEAAFKAQTADACAEIEKLEEEIRSFALENKMTIITGESAEVKFSKKASRVVDPAKLLNFLKSLGKTIDFWKYAAVTLKAVTGDYGSAVLESNGVINVKVNEYGTMKVTQK